MKGNFLTLILRIMPALALFACNKLDLQNELETKAVPKVERRMGEDSVIRLACMSKSGKPLEQCDEKIHVECFMRSRGEYCTQFTSPTTARMWGPY